MELGAGLEIARAIARLRDLESLGRIAVATAVHPDGAGMERAWLLEWDGVAGVLEGRHWAMAPTDGTALAKWLEARGVWRTGTDLSGLSVRPGRLGGVAGAAWSPAGSEPAAAEEHLPWSGAAHVGAVALRRSGLPWALLVGDWSVAADQDRRRALDGIGVLCSLAAQGLDREQEAARRAGHATALGQAVRALGSTRNVAEVLQLVVRWAAQGSNARGAALWLGGPETLRLEVTHGSAGRRERVGCALLELARAVVVEGGVRAVDRPTEEPLLTPEAAAAVETVVVCPLRAYGRVLGALACYDRVPARRSDAAGFPAAEVEFVSVLADLAGAAVDQAGRFDELRAGEQRRRELEERVRRLERLAQVGEAAGRTSHEARNPVASIGAFARRAQRALGEDDPAREYLEIILRESARLERLLAQQAEVAVEESALRLEDLNAVVQEVLSGLGAELAGRRVRLAKKLAPELPALLLDRARIRRVIVNILESVLDAVATGGRLRVETRQSGAAVLLEVAHDGPSEPGDLLEQLFVPFASQRPGGQTAGLGVAQQIVREHGGEIRVRGDGEWPTVFTLSLPVRENQDRRRSGTDRRRTRGERRRPRAAGGAS